MESIEIYWRKETGDYGYKLCECCGKSMRLKTALQKYCGPISDKNSCAYRRLLQNMNERNSSKNYMALRDKRNYGEHVCPECGVTYTKWAHNQKRCNKYDCFYKSFKSRLRNKKPVEKKVKKIVYIRNKSGRPSPVLLCPCGEKYIKTRVGQEKCIRCTNYPNVN